MKRISFSKNWEFQWGEPSNFPMLQPNKVKVDLPYDFMIGMDVARDSAGGAEAGFYKGGTGSYTKYLELSEEEKQQVHILAIDGCFGNTKLVINGHLAQRHHYGYTPFEVHMDPYLHVGRNRITVTADTTDQPNGRWYSGAGLYRKVDLYTGEALHIPPKGISTYTRAIGPQALQVVKTTVENLSDMPRSVTLQICIREKASGCTVAATEEQLTIPANSRELSHVEVTIHD